MGIGVPGDYQRGGGAGEPGGRGAGAGVDAGVAEGVAGLVDVGGGSVGLG